MGYDIEKVEDEVLCVIESRTGSWDATNNKFQKDMSTKATSNWHFANYKDCKEK
jgi:hypothetical protein